MSDASGPSLPFPRKPSSKAPSLVLPRRRVATPLELSAASLEARKQIAEIVSVTRAPLGEVKQLDTGQAEILERSLRELEARLEEREHALEELESRLADRERDVAEAEALIGARAKLLEAARRTAPVKAGLSKEEQTALEQLKAALDQQEASLKEQKAAAAERERFIEQNEAKLFEKMMQQQEKETELEQRDEDLQAREKRLQAREIAADPAPAKAETVAPKKFDEFNE